MSEQMQAQSVATYPDFPGPWTCVSVKDAMAQLVRVPFDPNKAAEAREGALFLQEKLVAGEAVAVENAKGVFLSGPRDMIGSYVVAHGGWAAGAALPGPLPADTPRLGMWRIMPQDRFESSFASVEGASFVSPEGRPIGRDEVLASVRDGSILVLESRFGELYVGDFDTAARHVEARGGWYVGQLHS